MAVTAVGATGAQATADKTATRLAENFDNFLKLLTTQLRNQDPLEPLSPTEFTTQLVQFTGVEQQIAVNSSLKELIAVQRATQSMTAPSFLGKVAEAPGDTAPLSDGVAEFGYNLESAATEATLEILDELGRVMIGFAGETGAGKHRLVWNGRDASGTLQPDGLYRLRVRANDANGPVSSTTTAAGRVTGVNVEGDEIRLSLGGVTISAADVIELREPPRPAGNSA